MESESNKILDEVTQGDYKYGFVTDIETEYAPKGLTEDTIRYISSKKNEPEFKHKIRFILFGRNIADCLFGESFGGKFSLDLRDKAVFVIAPGYLAKDLIRFGFHRSII